MSVAIRLGTLTFIGVVVLSQQAYAQDGSLLTALENEVASAAGGWEVTVMRAARSLFWILAGIEIGVAAVWLALETASLDRWFAELVRRVMFIGFFVFVLEKGPHFARATVDSLVQLGATGGSASPARVFNAGLNVASTMSHCPRDARLRAGLGLLRTVSRPPPASCRARLSQRCLRWRPPPRQ